MNEKKPLAERIGNVFGYILIVILIIAFIAFVSFILSAIIALSYHFIWHEEISMIRLEIIIATTLILSGIVGFIVSKIRDKGGKE